MVDGGWWRQWRRRRRQRPFFFFSLHTALSHIFFFLFLVLVVQIRSFYFFCQTEMSHLWRWHTPDSSLPKSLLRKRERKDVFFFSPFQSMQLTFSQKSEKMRKYFLYVASPCIGPWSSTEGGGGERGFYFPFVGKKGRQREREGGA